MSGYENHAFTGFLVMSFIETIIRTAAFVKVAS
jgi:hypothetical protein